MSRIIKKACDRCGAINTVDLDELQGMPLKNKAGEVVVAKPKIELDKPIHVECDSCHGPFIITAEDEASNS